MLKNPPQVGNWNSSLNESTPRKDKNIDIGEPRAKKFAGLNDTFG